MSDPATWPAAWHAEMGGLILCQARAKEASQEACKLGDKPRNVGLPSKNERHSTPSYVSLLILSSYFANVEVSRSVDGCRLQSTTIWPDDAATADSAAVARAFGWKGFGRKVSIL
jgi:hypothetical protein